MTFREPHNVDSHFDALARSPTRVRARARESAASRAAPGYRVGRPRYRGPKARGPTTAVAAASVSLLAARSGIRAIGSRSQPGRYGGARVRGRGPRDDSAVCG